MTVRTEWSGAGLATAAASVTSLDTLIGLDVEVIVSIEIYETKRGCTARYSCYRCVWRCIECASVFLALSLSFKTKTEINKKDNTLKFTLNMLS